MFAVTATFEDTGNTYYYANGDQFVSDAERAVAYDDASRAIDLMKQFQAGRQWTVTRGGMKFLAIPKYSVTQL